MTRALALSVLIVAACGTLRPTDVAEPTAQGRYTQEERSGTQPPTEFLPRTVVADRQAAAVVTPAQAALAFQATTTTGPTPALEGAPAVHPGTDVRTTDKDVWWSVFGDPALDRVEQEALHNNYFLRDVRTLIYENYLDPAVPWSPWLSPLQLGILTPASAQHVTLGSAPVIGQPGYGIKYNQYTVDLGATYQLDLWGNLEAKRQVGINLAEQQRQSTEGAAQNTAVQVAQLWFDILSQRALLELTQREVAYNQQLFDLVKARFESHLSTHLVVLQQEQQLLNIQAQVPLIAAQIATLNSQLSGLMGRLPDPHDALIPPDRRLPDLPPDPPVGAPLDLIANLPEMRFARLRVTEIESRVNENQSSWLPVVTLNAGVGVTTFTFENAETFRDTSWGVTLSWPIFDGGARIRAGKQLQLTLKRRKWQYDLALKTAIGHVQDAMLQEQAQADSLRSLRKQVELGHRLLDEARRLFEQGQSDYLPVLTALSNLSALERDGLRAQRLLINYRIQLYRALGGTWSYDATTVPD
ncbi:MAG TPA: TolC family protein [Kofleriaceae bacterium]|nr:TolC family protein [Kofleriaceae bacterium]